MALQDFSKIFSVENSFQVIYTSIIQYIIRYEKNFSIRDECTALTLKPLGEKYIASVGGMRYLIFGKGVNGF